MVYHVLNRGNARLPIFDSDADYEAFERVLEQAVERYGTDLLAWCLMPNHWHLVVRPHVDGELSRFVGWLTLTHTQRWRHGDARENSILAPWPVRRHAGWLDHVNALQTEAELAAIRHSVARGTPYGDERWTSRVVKQLGLETTVRPRGRPRNESGS